MPFPFRPTSSIKCRSQRGVALLLVLSFLALITVLVIAFFTSVSTEYSGAKRYANEVSCKELSDAAVQLVMSTVKQATSGTNPKDGTPIAWASQPGMIRTYNNNGNLLTYYKLYSADNLIADAATAYDASAEVPGTWNQTPALYSDINSPVVSGTALVFPILDGNNLVDGSTLTPPVPLVKPDSGKTYLTYARSGSAAIAGFYTAKPDTYSGSVPSPTNNPVPMPVRWIYVLKDGSLTVPSGSGGDENTAIWSGSINAPSAVNPIVGRIAFWADDETCKININTASEGTYWDIPRAQTAVDGTLGLYAPTKYEYQRYPGHPAMTSLSTVFPALKAEDIYKIVPRVAGGGSGEGTVATAGGASVTPPSVDTDRLYSTAEEILFAPSRSANNAANIDRAAVEQAKFFITASGRSPDVNLFNLPRVCVWPISNSDDAAHRSAYDRLIAFCSTLRPDLATPYRFYFQRGDPADPTNDLPSTSDSTGLNRNRMLLEYLRRLASQNIPGFGGNFASKYSASNGASGTDCDQILAEIFDYIRSSNLSDPNVTSPYTGTSGTSIAGQGQVVPIEDSATNTRGFGRFRTVEGGSFLFIANADGDAEASQPKSSPLGSGTRRIQACFLPQLFDVSEGAVFDTPNFTMEISGLDSLSMGGQKMYASSPIVVAQGTSTGCYYSGAFWGDQMGFRQVLASNISLNTTSALVSASVDVPKGGGTFSFSGGKITIVLKTPSGKTVQTAELQFPAQAVPLPSLAPSNVYNYDSSGNLVSAARRGPYNLRYFQGVPLLAKPNTSSTNTALDPDLPGANEPSSGGRMATDYRTTANAWITSYDVVRSVACAADLRLVAARKTVPAPGTPAYPFASPGGTGDTSQGTHTLFDGAATPYYGALIGKLVQDIRYDGISNSSAFSANNGLAYAAMSSGMPGGKLSLKPYNFTDAFDPATGKGINGVAMGKTSSLTTGDIPGDWDNGICNLRDGPFINKADEGDSGSSSTAPYNWKARTGSFPLSASLFTPNREIPSAVMFGSLPTGVFANKPWQTLLFRPGPAGHTGLGTSASGTGDDGPPYTIPPDHLLLDWFNMPVVEPYAVSDPLSTAGRINMNYQIAPFNYIVRETGLRAVLKSEQVICISNTTASTYKAYTGSSLATVRYPVNADATLLQFASRFAQNDLFRSASEICSIDLVPANPSLPSSTANHPTRTAMDTFWSSNALTGDNSRERPYATVYPRLTTKSNTYTVYFRVQTLQQTKGNGTRNWQSWNEARDKITAEYRGLQTIERYINPADAAIKDYADPSVSTPIDACYKFRILASKQFAP